MLQSYKALEETSDAIGVADLQGKAIYHNNAFLERFGFAPEELNDYGGLPWIFTDEGLTEEILATVKSGKSWSGEIELRTKDGIVLPSLVRTDCIFDEVGGAIGMIAICTDITDRKLAEILLKESEERYRAVVEDQTELIFRFNAQDRITFVNRAFADFFFATPGTLLKRRLSRLMPKSREAFRQASKALTPEQPHTSFELHTVRSDGARHWHQWTIRALFDHAGSPIEYQAVGRDVTAQKTADEALRESEEQHRFLAEHASDMIARQDTDGSFLFVSRACERLFGYNPDDLVRRSTFDLIHDEDRERFRAEFASLLDDKTLITSEYRFKKRDGTYVWVESTVRTVRNLKGNVVALMSAMRDITQRKRQEAKRAHRLRVEDALLKVSRLLISSRHIDFDLLLDTIGRAVDAQHVFLHMLTGDGNAANLVGRWKAPGAEDRGHYIQEILSKDDAWLRTRLNKGFVVATQLKFASAQPDSDAQTDRPQRPTALLVPILSEENHLMGYIEFDTLYPNYIWPTEDIRILCVLGDMLASYFERNRFENALQESEEKYRTFVATISEAIWCLELEQPIDIGSEISDQVEEIRKYAILSECNEVFSNTMAGCEPGKIIGRKLQRIFECSVDDLIREFVAGGYRIANEDFAVQDAEGRERHFIFNIVGIVENGHLRRAWGSQIDITPQVELKRRMVSALEDQQQRIGHDLHDGVGPYLTSIRMLSENLAEHLHDEDGRNKTQAQKIASLAHEAAHQVRKIYRGLTPLQLYREGLVMALQDIANGVNDLPGVTCSFEREGDLDIYDNKKKIHLYRIAQEAVNNALKHGRPSRIWITFSGKPDACLLQVNDDGTGFDQSNLPRDTLGVAGMYFRAKMINAELKIESRLQEGTLVKCMMNGSVN